ncbi:MAG: DUF5013 domain-containing protein [Pedobacter sp.]|nr:DUF5013 domain-containing protein [Pedobacter sp.]
MNRLFIPIVFFFFTAALASCSKKDDVKVEPVNVERPFVDYTIVPGDDPFTFKFENTSKNYKELEWRFGDDSLSTKVSPEHVYPKAGIFEVNLKATSADGSTARKLLVIKIVADSIADFVAVKTDAENTVKFSSSSKSIIKSFKWTFHDGATSTEANPVKKYDPNKFFDASLDMVTAKGSVIQLKRKVTSGGSLVDVTDNYILNAGPSFVAKTKVDRWGILADWTVNDAVKQRGAGMGSWDSYSGGQWLSMESWNGEVWITNGKIYQTMDLRAGTYYFNAIYRDYQINNAGKSYMVMAEGNTLPDVNDVETKSLGFYRLMGNGPIDVVAGMTITKTTTVSLGLSCTMEANSQTIKCGQVRLYKAYSK